MDESARRLRQLEADLDAARARHQPVPPVISAGGFGDAAAKTGRFREPVGALLLGGAALVLALWAITQATEAARLNRETARLSVLPSLEFVIDTKKQTLSLHNYGNGPAAIYYAKLTHRDWTIEQYRNVTSPVDLQSFFPVVLSNLFNDPSFSPKTTTSGMTRVLDDGESLLLLSIDTAMSKAQKDKFRELPQQVKIEFCYTNLLGDSPFWAGFGTEEKSANCPRPQGQGTVSIIDG
jgi:hypothetical protein